MRLAGPASNPDGTGAVVRPVRADKAGPAIASGVGSYGSPSGTTLLTGDLVERVQVQWPDGSQSSVAVGAGATTVTIRHGER